MKNKKTIYILLFLSIFTHYSWAYNNIEDYGEHNVRGNVKSIKVASKGSDGLISPSGKKIYFNSKTSDVYISLLDSLDDSHLVGVFEYDQNQNLLMEQKISYIWHGSQYSPLRKILYYYNVDGLLVNKLEYQRSMIYDWHYNYNQQDSLVGYKAVRYDLNNPTPQTIKDGLNSDEKWVKNIYLCTRDSLGRKVNVRHNEEYIEYFYDNQGLLVKTITKNKIGTQRQTERCIYTYDTTTNILNKKEIYLTESSYDTDKNFLLKQIDEYNPNGNISKSSLFSHKSGEQNATHTYSYDQYGNLLQIEKSNAEFPLYQYTYDQHGNWISRAEYRVEGRDRHTFLNVVVRQIEYWEE